MCYTHTPPHALYLLQLHSRRYDFLDVLGGQILVGACCVFSKLHWTYTPNQLHPHPRRYDFLDVPGRQILVFVLRSVVWLAVYLRLLLSLWSRKHLCAFSVAEKARAGRFGYDEQWLTDISEWLHACISSCVLCVCFLFLLCLMTMIPRVQHSSVVCGDTMSDLSVYNPPWGYTMSDLYMYNPPLGYTYVYMCT